MSFLGDLGAQKDVAAADEFGWFGLTIRTNPGLSELHIADFMEGAGDLDLDDPRQALLAMARVKAFIRDLIHPDDFEPFWAAAKAHGQRVTDLILVGQRVVEAAVDRPTWRPTASTDGPSSTPTSSGSDPASIVERAHPGRPDLQVGALRAVESMPA